MNIYIFHMIRYIYTSLPRRRGALPFLRGQGPRGAELAEERPAADQQLRGTMVSWRRMTGWMDGSPDFYN